MPLEKIVNQGDSVWALWKIVETEAELRQLVRADEHVPEGITNIGKRLEWLAGRMLTAHLVTQFGLKYEGLVKDEHGKPFLRNHTHQMSLSHSFPYVAAIVHGKNPVGIDLEQPKPKLLRVAPRVLSVAEQTDAGTDTVKHCVYWCAKETLIKVYGKKDLILAEQLIINPFELKPQGDIIGRILVGNKQRLIPLYYQVFPGFVLVLSNGNEESPANP